MNTVGGYGLLLLTSVLTSAGQLCQKQASGLWQRLDGRPERVRITALWLGLACAGLGFGMLSWLFVLRVLPVSQAYPMLSLNFVVVALAARFCFGEVTTLRHWGGIAAIMLGVVLLGIRL